jgi:hypothetical protein
MPRRNTRGGIYKTLSYRINTWVCPPGQRLTDEEISDEFKVSRSPVREALNMLACPAFRHNRSRTSQDNVFGSFGNSGCHRQAGL